MTWENVRQNKKVLISDLLKRTPLPYSAKPSFISYQLCTIFSLKTTLVINYLFIHILYLLWSFSYFLYTLFLIFIFLNFLSFFSFFWTSTYKYFISFICFFYISYTLSCFFFSFFFFFFFDVYLYSSPCYSPIIAVYTIFISIYLFHLSSCHRNITFIKSVIQIS